MGVASGAVLSMGGYYVVTDNSMPKQLQEVEGLVTVEVSVTWLSHLFNNLSQVWEEEQETAIRPLIRTARVAVEARMGGVKVCVSLMLFLYLTIRFRNITTGLKNKEMQCIIDWELSVWTVTFPIP